MEQFRGRTGQYVFISSASAYQKPPARLPILESTPLRNPFWQYSRDKIACEDLLVRAYREDGFPVTIVRPSHTYDRTRCPSTGGWTDIARMRAGRPVLVHGDGTSLWTLTHGRDFAMASSGCWAIRRPSGTASPSPPTNSCRGTRSTQPGARLPGHRPDWCTSPRRPSPPRHRTRAPGCWATSRTRWSSTTPRSRPLGPEFRAAIPYFLGAREVLEWHDAHPEACDVDGDFMELTDRLGAWARG